MKGRLVITRGAAVGFVVFGVAMIAAMLWMIQLNAHLHDQQVRTDQVLAQHVTLMQRDARTLTLVCKLATGMALNQPNLDARFLTILNEVIGELPAKCFPPTSPSPH